MYIYIYIICCPTLRRMATTAWSISWFGLQIGQRRCSAQPWRLGGLGASSGFHQIYGDSMLTWVMIKGYTPRVTSDIETIEEPKPLDLSWRFLVPVSFAYVYKYLYIYICTPKSMPQPSQVQTMSRIMLCGWGGSQLLSAWFLEFPMYNWVKQPL